MVGSCAAYSSPPIRRNGAFFPSRLGGAAWSPHWPFHISTERRSSATGYGQDNYRIYTPLECRTRRPQNADEAPPKSPVFADNSLDSHSPFPQPPQNADAAPRGNPPVARAPKMPTSPECDAFHACEDPRTQASGT